MTQSQSPDATLMVGSVSESTQHVVLENVTTDARSRALRAPCWAIVVGVQLCTNFCTNGGLAQLLEALVQT